VIANLVEFPAVARGAARLRLQVMAKHNRGHIDRFIDGLEKAHAEACLVEGDQAGQGPKTAATKSSDQ
jgi:glycine C-acetyltransferase